MLEQETPVQMHALDISAPIWNHFFMVHPLVLIGTKEEDGDYNLSPKHMVLPLGWHNHFGIVGTPRHQTYHNIIREGAFTVSFPRPSQVSMISLAASQRLEDGTKPILKALPTQAAQTVDGIYLEGAYCCLECEVARAIEIMPDEMLIVGKIVAANVHPDALRVSGQDDNELINQSPQLAYLAPSRFASIDVSNGFPFPINFSR